MNFLSYTYVIPWVHNICQFVTVTSMYFHKVDQLLLFFVRPVFKRSFIWVFSLIDSIEISTHRSREIFRNKGIKILQLKLQTKVDILIRIVIVIVVFVFW